MKKILALLLLLPFNVLAQGSSLDPGIATCTQLLAEANSRLIALSADNAKLTASLKAAQDELSKMKSKTE